MNICIRIDDIGFMPHYELDKGLQLARSMHDALEGLPYLAAVIPGILDEEGASWIRSRPAGMTRALHGWKHAYGMHGGNCEFEDMGPALCGSLLHRGLSMIEGDQAIIDIVPPRNAIEPDMTDACRRDGLRRLWGQAYATPYPCKPELKSWGLYLPSWEPLYGMTLWRVSDDRRPVTDVLRGIQDQEIASIVVLHLTWEASMSPSFNGIKAFRQEFGDRIVTPEKYIELAGVKN